MIVGETVKYGMTYIVKLTNKFKSSQIKNGSVGESSKKATRDL